jgi:hypothetical protein
MNIETAANFLVGSILFSLSLVVITSGIILVNNLIAKYWRTVTLWNWDYRYIDIPREPSDATVDEKQQTPK